MVNNVYLDNQADQLLIITGPNMSGKSTYLRQTALIVIMAQIGSFVPAEAARLGIVDRVFTRVGASDDLHLGQSTFLVEMSETANILRQATPRSLVLLDEIGRGTSTYDGMSIAWAVVEFLHNKVKAKSLFATHFHELTHLEKFHSGIKNFRVAVKESLDEILFLHKIVPGGTDRSYGIYVARLAGIPMEVLQRAQEILENFEREKKISGRRLARPARKAPEPSGYRQLTLFDSRPNPHPLLEKIRNLDINSLTPIEALNKIHEWKKLLDGKKEDSGGV